MFDCHHQVGVTGDVVGVQLKGPLLLVVVQRDELHVMVMSFEAQEK